VKHNYYL